jgi:sugar phosphate isomerase/epimerase
LASSILRFRALSLDEMLDKFSSLGVEAVEIGAGGYTGTPQCPVPELLADPAKARAWKKKFDDRGIPIMTISCHANALHPDPTTAAAFAEQFRQAIQLAGMLEIPTVVGFSGCPGGSPTMSSLTGSRITGRPITPSRAGLAVERARHSVLAGDGQVRARARSAQDRAGNAPQFRRLQSANPAAPARGGRGRDRRELRPQPSFLAAVRRRRGHPISGKQGAIYHAHMKDTAFFRENVDRFGVLNFDASPADREGSEFFRAVGYGHGASVWKDIIAAYMEVGYNGMLSVEHEDPLLNGELGVTRSLSVLKNVREELLANQPNPGEVGVHRRTHAGRAGAAKV